MADEKEVPMQRNDPPGEPPELENSSPRILFVVADRDDQVMLTLSKAPGDCGVFTLYEGGSAAKGDPKKGAWRIR